MLAVEGPFTGGVSTFTSTRDWMFSYARSVSAHYDSTAEYCIYHTHCPALPHVPHYSEPHTLSSIATCATLFRATHTVQHCHMCHTIQSHTHCPALPHVPHYSEPHTLSSIATCATLFRATHTVQHCHMCHTIQSHTHCPIMPHNFLPCYNHHSLYTYHTHCLALPNVYLVHNNYVYYCHV